MFLGIRNGINSRLGFGPRGLGTTIINIIENLLWADRQVDDYLEDQKGATTYEAVRPAKVVGDGSTYMVNIVLANLPITYTDGNGVEQTDVFNASGEWLIDLNGFSLLTCSLATYNAQTLINPDGTFKDYLEDISGNGNHAQQILQPSIPALYDDSLVGSKYNDDGYTIADGNQYIDEALTTAYGVGERISALDTTKCIGWVSDGLGGAERASLDFKGRVKFDVDIVDGVVDLELETFTDDSDLTSIVNGNSVVVTNSTASAFKDTNITVDSSNTEKTIVVSGRILYGTDNPVINITTLGGSALATINMSLVETEYRQTFTPTDGGYVLKIWSSFSTAEEQSKEYYDFAVYEGDYVTGTPPLPTTNEFVQGNTWKLDPAYNKAVIADTNEHVFDKLDPTEVVSKLNNCEDRAFTGDYLFSSLTNGIVAMYEEAQTGSDLVEILLAMGFNEPLLTSLGEQVTDSNGEDLYVYKEGVIRT